MGEVRIGVSIANLAARLPHPHGVINNTQQAVSDINKLATGEQAIAIVVGLPRGLNGQDTKQTERVRDFVKKLQKVCNLPIHLQDEALTSKKAEQELSQRRIRYNKDEVDALAATYILTDFLLEHMEFGK